MPISRSTRLHSRPQTSGSLPTPPCFEIFTFHSVKHTGIGAHFRVKLYGIWARIRHINETYLGAFQSKLWPGPTCLSPGSTLRHQIPTLPRHYPDTTPTPRHSDTSVNRHSVRHSDTSVRPVSSHLDSGPPRTVSMVSSRCQDKTDTPTLDTSDTPDTPTLRHYRPRC